MKIKANAAIKDIWGNDIKGSANPEIATKGNFTVGDALSNILLSAKTGGKMKLFALSEKFANDKEVEVDSADLIMIKQCIDTSDTYNNLVTGQLLVMLENIKDEKNSAKKGE